MSLDIIPEEIITQYELRIIAVNGWVYMEIRKGMPGLRQAGKMHTTASKPPVKVRILTMPPHTCDVDAHHNTDLLHFGC